MEIAALIHSEVSEFVEAERDGIILDGIEIETGKPIGPASELADVIIRVLDYAHFRGIDMDGVVKAKMEYNKTRSHRHGGKRY
jgi:NTP pyrophosphatase (non-canonical NTP hydrolase)